MVWHIPEPAKASNLGIGLRWFHLRHNVPLALCAICYLSVPTKPACCETHYTCVKLDTHWVRKPSHLQSGFIKDLS